MKKTVPVYLFLLLMVGALAAQSPPAGRRHLPPPLRVHVPYEMSWKGLLAATGKLKLTTALEDRARGRLLTEFQEYSSGPLAEAHIAKVGEKPRLVDGDWVRVEYQYDVSVQLISEKETLVTAYSNIRALKREFLGGEKWVQIPSNGRLEEELLTHFGRELFGESFTLGQPRKGFWERDPGYIPEADLRPDVAGPERRRP